MRNHRLEVATADVSDIPDTRYRFGPLERRGFLAGWRGGQAAIVAAGLLVGVGALRALPDAAGLAVAVVAVAVSLAAATWPIAGRAGDEWFPDVARYAANVLLGRKWRAPRKPTGDPCARSGQPQKGGPFSALRILQVDAGHESAAVLVSSPGSGAGHTSGRSAAAVVYDPRERTYTAVMPASGPGFVLLAGSERDRRVSGWSAALGALSRQGTPVHRVQWVARTVPGAGGGSIRDSGNLPMGSNGNRSGASASYDEFLAATRPTVCRHQVLLAMSVRVSRPGLIMRPPGAQDHASSCALLLRELAAFRRRLSDAEVDSAPPLAPRALASVIRAGFSSSRWAWPEECATTWPWPVAGEVLWDVVRMDGTWHATYWVAEWPRTDIGADFLGPLLLANDVRQSVSVTMEPLSPVEAVRRAQQARTADVADAELRRRGGFLHTARRRREEET
ncbi:MAG TPA: SCO6880 family protein, partial [Acidimicrobiales bacterium]|nr:SCO6880 family protein [Acidimicrobiales bacterium]